MINKIDLIARWLLGLIFIVFGLNGFLHFIPMPEPTPESGAFFYALLKTGYFLPVLKLTEIISGVLLVLGRFVPLALTLLAPVIVQIFLFHILLIPILNFLLSFFVVLIVVYDYKLLVFFFFLLILHINQNEV